MAFIFRVFRRRRRKSKQVRRGHYLLHKEHARALILGKVNHFSGLYGCTLNKIFIKNQRTCWGSCSKKGNLNFNYKILFLPEKAQDYIIVHEVCHLKEFNHSKRFWDLVAKTIPDYLEIRRG